MLSYKLNFWCVLAVELQEKNVESAAFTINVCTFSACINCFPWKVILLTMLEEAHCDGREFGMVNGCSRVRAGQMWVPLFAMYATLCQRIPSIMPREYPLAGRSSLIYSCVCDSSCPRWVQYQQYLIRWKLFGWVWSWMWEVICTHAIPGTHEGLG